MDYTFVVAYCLFPMLVGHQINLIIYVVVAVTGINSIKLKTELEFPKFDE